MFASMIIAVLLGLARAEVPAAGPLASKVSMAVKDHVAAVARVDVKDVELRWLGLGVALDCPSDAQVLVDSRAGEDFRGRTELWVTLLAGSEECARVRLPSRIAIWQDVQVAVRDASVGEEVQMMKGRAPRDLIRGQPVDPNGGKWIALHPVRTGEAITDRDVVLAPSVLAGDPVVLEVVYGRLHIVADARMLNDGRVGERVRVANNATGTVVTGKLVDARTVRVGGSK